MTTVVCAAHADDEIIGVGGTIAKLAKKEDIIVIIFSYGVGFASRLTSIPFMMKEEKLVKTRVLESKKAGEELGVKETIFLGIKDSLPKELNDEQKQKIKDILNKYKPDKIFYHSIKDGHPDHNSVTKTMKKILEKIKIKPKVYTYQINFFDISKKDPMIIFDVSETFQKKLDAMDEFKSQKIWIAPLKFFTLLKGIFFGKKYGFKFAEYFYAE